MKRIRLGRRGRKRAICASTGCSRWQRKAAPMRCIRVMAFSRRMPAFAEAVERAGLTWIGPAPESIRDMGDKQRARDIAVAAGVPVVPGSRRFEHGDLGGLDDAAAAVGFPLLVKAAAGGGGIGMRRVDRPEQLAEIAAATQSMAAKAFGNGAIFLERYIPKARHVEIQVFGFGNGEAVHLFERDCSLQRRFQKVIEESPAPNLPQERARSHGCRRRGAVPGHALPQRRHRRIYRRCRQLCVLLSRNEHPHPGRASGHRNGHRTRSDRDADRSGPRPSRADAPGRRIAQRGMPSRPGSMPKTRPRTSCRRRAGSSVSGRRRRDRMRVDAGYREGDTITPFYDPMVAKVIAQGDTRDEARHSLIGALQAFEIEGIRNNRDFLIACLADEAFAAGDVSTGFIDRRLDSSFGAGRSRMTRHDRATDRGFHGRHQGSSSTGRQQRDLERSAPARLHRLRGAHLRAASQSQSGDGLRNLQGRRRAARQCLCGAGSAGPARRRAAGQRRAAALRRGPAENPVREHFAADARAVQRSFRRAFGA